MAVLVAMTSLAGGRSESPVAVVRAGEIGMIVGQFFAWLVAVVAAAGQCATGGSRSNVVLWTPTRSVLFGARALVLMAVVAGWAVAVAGVADLLAWVALGPDGHVDALEIVASLATIAFVTAAGSGVSFGFAFLMRSTAGALAGVLLVMVALPAALAQLFGSPLFTVGAHLPGHAVLVLLQPGVFDTTTSAAVLVLLTWTTTALIAGAWSFVRRDAP